MATEERELAGHFHLGYDERECIFEAYVSESNSAHDSWMLAEVSRSLEELLEKCRQRGLVHFDGMNQAAINRIHRWMVVERPALEYVEECWGSVGPSKRGPIGFRPNNST